MSPRAAARLEALGFGQVYDYVGGKKAWLSAGLPTEGEKSGQPRSGDLARRQPPTCRPDDSVDDLRDRSDIGLWGVAVVVDDRHVVHGVISPRAIPRAPNGSRVDAVMELGPTTIRPSRSMESALDRMDDLGADHVLVTTEFGELVGVLYRSDIEPDDG